MDWTCGRDGKHPEPLTDGELDGVRSAMSAYKSTELVARLLATIDANRVPHP